MREKHIHLRLTDSEYRQLNFLADKEKRKPCSLLRYLIALIATQNGYSDSTEAQFISTECTRRKISLAFTEDEWTRLEWQRVAHAFESSSAYVLSVVRQEIMGASLMPAVEILEFQKYRSELNYIGHNVNQIAKRVNSERGATPEDLRTVLNEVRRAQKILLAATSYVEKASFRHSPK